MRIWIHLSMGPPSPHMGPFPLNPPVSRTCSYWQPPWSGLLQWHMPSSTFVTLLGQHRGYALPGYNYQVGLCPQPVITSQSNLLCRVVVKIRQAISCIWGAEQLLAAVFKLCTLPILIQMLKSSAMPARCKGCWDISSMTHSEQ